MTPPPRRNPTLPSFALCLATLCATGCSTLDATVRKGPRFYGGVRSTCAFLVNDRHPLLFFRPVWYVCAVLDLPLSFAVDTALLPVSVPYSLLAPDPNQSPVERHAELFAELADDDPAVHEPAAARLRERVAEDVARRLSGNMDRALVEALRHPHPRVRLHAARGLGEFGQVWETHACARLVALLDDAPLIQAAALETLERVDVSPEDEDIPALERLLDHELPAARRLGALLLGSLGAWRGSDRARVLERLSRVLEEDPDEGVRYAALETLERIR